MDTKINKLKYQGDIDDSIKSFNSTLNDVTKRLAIARYGNNVYLEENENDTRRIINSLFIKTMAGIPGYKSQANAWVVNHNNEILGSEKKEIIINMFDKSTVYLIYGAAGTGKSTIIRFIFNVFGNNVNMVMLFGV